MYKTLTLVEGYFIRKPSWQTIINNPDFKSLTGQFSQRVKHNYEKNIKVKMLRKKNGMLKKIGHGDPKVT